MTYATAEDVAARLGRELSTEETALVAVRLADVERMILRRVPDLAEKITAEDVDEADVVQVEADAVVRLVRNPEGYGSPDLSVGGFSAWQGWSVAAEGQHG